MPIRVLLLALFLLAVAAPSPALAIDPAYLGYWAGDAAACTLYDAFRITPEGFSSSEELCRTQEAHKEDEDWVVRLRCASEGSDSNVTVRWRLSQDGRLREIQDGRTTTYVRCEKMMP
jgi:hypothetical protein